MVNTQFHSTAFYLDQWAGENKTIESTRPNPVIEDIKANENNRRVCKGSECSLYFNKIVGNYHSLGCCERNNLCTEARILKDKLFIKEGLISNTMNSLNYEIQLLNWKISQ